MAAGTGRTGQDGTGSSNQNRFKGSSEDAGKQASRIAAKRARRCGGGGSPSAPRQGSLQAVGGRALAGLFGSDGWLARLSGRTRHTEHQAAPLLPPPTALRPRSDRLLQRVRGIALDHRGRSRPPVGKRPAGSLLDGSLPPADAPHREEALLGFCRALAAQPHCYRQALILRKVYGLSLSEVAARLGVSAERVEKLIGRGLAGLQQHLQDKGLG